MEWVGPLRDLGFWEGGSPKGFEADGERLTIWVKGGPMVRARRDLLAAVGVLGRRSRPTDAPLTWATLTSWGWVISETDQCVTIEVKVTTFPYDVYIIGPAGASEESRRWRSRGYRVSVVADRDPVPTEGLIIRSGPSGLSFSGRLGRHPASSPVVQPWH